MYLGERIPGCEIAFRTNAQFPKASPENSYLREAGSGLSSALLWKQCTSRLILDMEIALCFISNDLIHKVHTNTQPNS